MKLYKIYYHTPGMLTTFQLSEDILAMSESNARESFMKSNSVDIIESVSEVKNVSINEIRPGVYTVTKTEHDSVSDEWRKEYEKNLDVMIKAAT